MVRPHIAVITNIGDAHIEFLGSREGILKAKSEIFENLDADGVAILNGDDALLDTVALPQRIVRCGESAHADVRVSALRDRGIDGIACTVTTERAEYQLNIPAPGRHMIYAASLAAAVGEELGLSVPEIERGCASTASAATADCSTTATTPTRSPCPQRCACLRRARERRSPCSAT